ncbi:MAG: hypothetical protein WD673_06400 [Alphaproteobacteria bacterium]
MASADFDGVAEASRRLDDALGDARSAASALVGSVGNVSFAGGTRDDVLAAQEDLSAKLDAIRAERFQAESEHLNGIVALNREAASEIEGAFDAGLGAVRRQFRTLEFDARAVLRAIVGDIAGSFLDQGLGSLAGGGLLGFLGGLFQGAFASGGSVVSDRPALVGEQGPEIFVPRGAGTVLPNEVFRAGAPSIVVNQTVTIATGVAPTVRAEMAALLPAFKRETIAAVIDAQRRSAGSLI